MLFSYLVTTVLEEELVGKKEKKGVVGVLLQASLIKHIINIVVHLEYYHHHYVNCCNTSLFISLVGKKDKEGFFRYINCTKVVDHQSENSIIQTSVNYQVAC